MNEVALARVLAKARGDIPGDPAAHPGALPTPEPNPPEPGPAPGPAPVPLVDAGNPKGTLWALLDIWASMDEAEWTADEVDALYNTILAFWIARPGEAEGWWREWRAAHPEAQLS